MPMIDRIVQQKKFMLDDGFYYFDADNGGGVYSPRDLREIADALDQLNKPWQDQIETDLNVKSSNSGSPRELGGTSTSEVSLRDVEWAFICNWVQQPQDPSTSITVQPPQPKSDLPSRRS